MLKHFLSCIAFNELIKLYDEFRVNANIDIKIIVRILDEMVKYLGTIHLAKLHEFYTDFIIEKRLKTSNAYLNKVVEIQGICAKRFAGQAKFLQIENSNLKSSQVRSFLIENNRFF